MSGKSLRISFLLTFFLLLAPAALGAEYFVSTSGNDSNPGTSASPWRTIQKAVDTIAPGDTITVMPGTYAGARIEKGGTPTGVKTLRSQTKWAALLNAPSAGRAKHNGILELEDWDVTGPIGYWVIDGFEVDGKSMYRCIDMRGAAGSSTTAPDPAQHLTVRNNHVHHAKASASSVATGIFDGNAEYSLYENNVTHHNTEHGMYHSNSGGDYAVIRGNTSYSNSGAGYHNNGDISLGTPGVIRYVLYEKNIAYDNGGGAGINCDGEANSVYRNNLIYGNRGNGMTFYYGNAALPSSNNQVYNNTILEPASTRYCVLIGPDCANNRFFNNILYNGGPKGSYTIVSTHPTGFQSDYNVVTANGFNTDGDNTIGGTTFAQWQALGYDTHSIVATPTDLFVNPAANDYHLKAGSPAIDAGTDLSSVGGSPINASVVDDFDGVARPQGTAFDIGCFEYSSTPTVAKPQFSPPAGTYVGSADVTITCATASAQIRYTTNGVDPTASSTLYTGTPVHITSTLTLKARAFKSGMADSAVESGLYTIGAPTTDVIIQQGLNAYTGWEDTWLDEDTPTTVHSTAEMFHLQNPTQDRQLHRFNLSPIPAGVVISSATLYIYQMTSSPVTGSPTVSAYRVLTHWIENQATYNKRTSVSNWASPGMSPGTDHDASPASTTPVIPTGTTGWIAVDVTSLVDGWYSGSFTNEGVMLKCSAAGHLRTYSSKYSPADQRPKLVVSYQAAVQTVAAPSFSPAQGTYFASVDVTLSCATSGAQIRYTTNGSDPTEASQLYSGPIHLTTTTAIKARAYKDTYTDSDITSATYTITNTVAAPVFTPPQGVYSAAVDVTISTTTDGASIYYTLNGSTPTTSSLLYSGTPLHLTAPTTLKAIAYRSPAPASPVTTGVYTVDAQAPTVGSIATVPTQVRVGQDDTVTLTAFATDAATGNSNITAAECFIGSDPGQGHGTPMSAADGSFNSAAESLIAVLDCSHWSPSTPVRLYARARDAAGHWSTAANLLVPVISAIPPGMVTDLKVTPDPSYTTAPLAIEAISSEAPGMPVDALFDGNIYSYWESAGTLTPEDEYIVVDLGSVQEIAAFAMVAGRFSALFPADFSIAVSENLSDWTTVAKAEGFRTAARSRHIWLFEPTNARYVRVTGKGVYYSRARKYLWQVAEVEVPDSLSESLATFQWTAPADDGYVGTPAAGYDLRCSDAPISQYTFFSATPVSGVGSPSAPGTPELVVADADSLVGRVFAAIKTVDALGNWSAISNIASNFLGGVKIQSTYPEDGHLFTSVDVPSFYYNYGSSIRSAVAYFSSTPGFPVRPQVRANGERDTTIRSGLRRGSSSWSPSVAQWRRIKRIVLSDGLLFWRIQGATTINRVRTYVYGPTRGGYFDLGSITDLTVSSTDPHKVDGKDAVWPVRTDPPVFSWASHAANAVKFYIDVSVDPEMNMRDRRRTTTFARRGVWDEQYQLTATEWLILRRFATLGNGVVFWRVRGTDRDGLLGSGSDIVPVVVDGGDWTLSDIPSLGADPVHVEWTNNAQGIVKYSLEFSVDPAFPASRRYTAKVPGRSTADFEHTLSARELLLLNRLALRNGVTTLYYRVRGEDIQRAFLAFSAAKTTSVP